MESAKFAKEEDKRKSAGRSGDRRKARSRKGNSAEEEKQEVTGDPRGNPTPSINALSLYWAEAVKDHGCRDVRTAYTSLKLGGLLEVFTLDMRNSCCLADRRTIEYVCALRACVACGGSHHQAMRLAPAVFWKSAVRVAGERDKRVRLYVEDRRLPCAT